MCARFQVRCGAPFLLACFVSVSPAYIPADSPSLLFECLPINLRPALLRISRSDMG